MRMFCTLQHLPNQQVVCVQDAHTTQFQGRILADGRFRILSQSVGRVSVFR